MPKTFYMLRHTMTLPQEGVKNGAWPLTALGQKQAEDLVEKLQNLNVTAIYTSPAVRAIQTVQPFATHSGLTPTVSASLDDQHIAEETMPPADFQALTKAMWQDFNHAEEGVETNIECQHRIVSGLHEIAEQSADTHILVCTHGGPLALLLNSIDPSFAYDDWANMPMPVMYKVVYDDKNLQWDAQWSL